MSQLVTLILHSSVFLPGAFWMYQFNSKDLNWTTSIAKVCLGHRKVIKVQICAHDVSGSGEISGMGSEEGGVKVESTASTVAPTSQVGQLLKLLWLNFPLLSYLSHL